MIDKKKKEGGGDSHEKAKDRWVEILFILLLIFALISGLGKFWDKLKSGGFRLPSPSSPSSSLASIKSPIGGKVSLSAPTGVFSPDGKRLGNQGAGASGVVTDGPIFLNGERYWFVDFDTGPDGWVPESVLQGENGEAFDPGDTPVGSRASLGGETGTQVFAEPGGALVGTQPDGASGTITKGPIYANGERYWFVDYESGPDGWVAESALGDGAGGQLSGGNTPIGSGAQTAGKTDVLGTPGGSSVGTQPKGAQGQITKGPEYVNGKKYWYVDFASGPDGWVSEDALRNSSGGAFNPGDSPVGSQITSADGTKVRSSPGGPQIGMQPEGAKGVVTKGPEYVNGERYWFVDYETGPDGWVSEQSLRDKNGGPFNPGSSLVGSKTKTSGGIPVLSSPGGKFIGAQPKTAKGTITRGPEYANGERYWYVDFDTGPDGWVSEKYLRDEKGGPFEAGSTPVGSRVYVREDSAKVYDSPGGKVIGTQERNAKGVIVAGPRFVNGKRYWKVDFDSGPDGWVEESQIEIVGKESAVSRFFSWVGKSLKLISTILSLIFATSIIYSLIRTTQITSARRRLDILKESPVRAAAAAKEYVNRRWETVIARVQSESPSDWRLAILESDIMLAELLDKMGYAGENVGEKLKKIEQSDFNTIEDAWEAHKIRNLIAHQGSDYVLSRREAQRVIGLYTNVFREFRYV